MSKDSHKPKDQFLEIIREIDLAARSVMAISDMACHYMESRTRDLEYENNMDAALHVTEQLGNYQRCMLDRIECWAHHMEFKEAPVFNSKEDISFNESMDDLRERKACA